MNKKDIIHLITMPFDEIIRQADAVRRENNVKEIDLCGIVNAKSGACAENCKFCAQSAANDTEIDIYDLLSVDRILREAEKAVCNGAKRFGIVTSGNRLNPDEVAVVASAVEKISKNLEIEPCASLGALDKGSFTLLRSAGLKRYHHNIETSERFYPNIVTSHDFAERVNTVKAAKESGFEVCSGGIIGIGETWEDRIDMTVTLKDLEVDSIPINILVPIKGTPMENMVPLSQEDILRTIAIFRIILRDKTIKVAAGRESALTGANDMIYRAGANGMMIGGYLTIAGRSVEEDLALVDKVEREWKN